MFNFGADLFFNFLLWQTYSLGLSFKPQCSDTVPLTDNVHGKMSIEPGSIVVPGTNITITCSGTDAEKRPGDSFHSDENFKIKKILVFNSLDLPAIRTCSITHDKKRECTVTLSNITTDNTATYSCTFGTDFDQTFSCYISKNLTVTEDVCSASHKPCSANAVCKKKFNTYTCICNQGFYQNGSVCQDIKECSNISISPCHKNAKCVELNGSFACNCNPGFTGNGIYCTDIKECSNLSISLCHKNAKCVELEGSFDCDCQPGFTGNGTYCKECSSGHCHVDANCTGPKRSFNCSCNDGLNGTRCEELKSGSNDINTSTRRWTIVGTVCGIVAICGSGIALLFYKQRKKNYHAASLKNEKRRVTAIDNLGILFPSNDDSKLVNSPRRILPSIEDHNKMDGSVEDEHSDTDCVFSYICVLDDWEIQRDNLRIFQKKLGGGQFGVVKKGVYINKSRENEEIPVAVKMLKDDSSANDLSDLLMELQILKEVNKQPHPNVIKLIGAITTEDPIMVITELCIHGNLKNILQKSRVKENVKHSPENYVNVVSTLSHRILLKFAVDIASGMKHLAAHQFVHRDLSARNILVSSNYEAKVSDFGLARPMSEDNQMYVKSNRNLLPVKWMALESLTHGVFRTSSDIWAFGVLLWEITTLGKDPYTGISPYDILNYVASGNRMDRPPQCSEVLYNVMLKCWDADQENRPDFTTMHEELTEMLEDKQQKPYINIIEFNDAASEISNSQSERIGSLSDLERYTLA